MKNFRNVTFLTYCNGAKVFNSIEKRIKEKMIEVGYTDSEIGMIFSQVCLAAISGEVIKNEGTSALAFTFGDVNDIDYANYKEEEKTIENINDMGKGIINYGSSLGFAIANDGEHGFKRHMTEDPILSSGISSFLNTSIENAIENKNSDIIKPITYEQIQNAFNAITETQGKSL